MADGLLDTDQWLRVLDELGDLGVTTLVVSGGGEALLNPNLSRLLARARERGLRRHVYTTGYSLARADQELWTELAHCNQVRFSIHAATEPLYSRVVGLPDRARALAKVADNLDALVALRDALGTECRVGAGYVILPDNADGLEDMAAWAIAKSLDFLAFRKDEVDATDALSVDQRATVAVQVDRIRTASSEGKHGLTRVDFSDELIAWANGLTVGRSRTAECRVKFSRPTISPYGVVAPCDLKAEPRFADGAFNLGIVGQTQLREVFADMPQHFVPDTCAQCMPSSRVSNAVQTKFLEDPGFGFPLSLQPFH